MAVEINKVNHIYFTSDKAEGWETVLKKEVFQYFIDELGWTYDEEKDRIVYPKDNTIELDFYVSSRDIHFIFYSYSKDRKKYVFNSTDNYDPINDKAFYLSFIINSSGDIALNFTGGRNSVFKGLIALDETGTAAIFLFYLYSSSTFPFASLGRSLSYNRSNLYQVPFRPADTTSSTILVRLINVFTGAYFKNLYMVYSSPLSVEGLCRATLYINEEYYRGLGAGVDLYNDNTGSGATQYGVSTKCLKLD